MNKNVVIMYSGGADSRLMVEIAKELGYGIHCVIIDYGQLISEEINIAKSTLFKLAIKYQVVKLEGLEIRSALTTGEKGLYENVSPFFVPNRNMMIVSIGVAIAESLGFDEVWIGSDYTDRVNLFTDCTQEFVYTVNTLLKITSPKKVSLRAPLLGLTKEMVLEILEKNGISKDEFFSGYGNL